jgi:hypothetical protein
MLIKEKVIFFSSKELVKNILFLSLIPESKIKTFIFSRDLWFNINDFSITVK